MSDARLDLEDETYNPAIILPPQSFGTCLGPAVGAGGSSRRVSLLKISASVVSITKLKLGGCHGSHASSQERHVRML